MRRLVILAALLAAAGCKRGSPAAEAPPAPPAPPEAAAEPKPEAPEAAAEAKPVQITEPMIDRYIGFEKERLAALDTYTTRNMERVKQIDKKDSAATLKTVAEADADAKKLDETVSALREKWKLSAEEQRELEQLFDSVAMTRMMWKQAGGDQMIQNVEKQMKEQIEKLPPDQRKESAAEMEKALASVKKQRDLTEAREKYGSPLVDYVLKTGEPLMNQRWDLLKKATGKK